MEEIIEILENNKAGVLATVKDGKPKARPFGFRGYIDNKFYFSTSNKKDVFNQLKENKFIEFVVTTDKLVTIRLAGEVTFIKDINIKKKIFEVNPGMEKSYREPENPIFEAFCIEHGEVIKSDFSGNPNLEIKF